MGITRISFTSTDSAAYDIFGVNSLHLIFNDADANFEEYNESKYLVFVLTDKNRKVLENYKERWSEIKDQIELISGNKPI